jgi:ribosomal protein S18 acetylase RimI-like enzyme
MRRDRHTIPNVSELLFRNVSDAERDRAYETLVSAFTNDPIERWMYPQLEQYLACFPAFVAAFGGRAFSGQTAWCLGDFAAVALWFPPGVEPDGDAIAAILSRTVSPDLHDELFEVLSQMEDAHPTYAHWYLPWFGVDNAQQGNGLGGELMKRCLQVVDESHLSVYLETPNPATIGFYERHGFVVTGGARGPTCPTMTFMTRDARR